MSHEQLGPDRTRRRRSISMSLVGVAASVLLAACGSSGSSSKSSTQAATQAKAATSSQRHYSGPAANLPTQYPAPTRKANAKFTIGFLNPTASNESLLALQQAIQKRAAQLGGNVLAEDDQLQPDKQVSDFQRLLTQKVNAIIVYPIDPTALAPVLRLAKSQGVPVVGIDVTNDPSVALPAGYGTEVWPGRDEEAFDQMKAVSGAKPGAKVGLIDTSVPVPGFIYLRTRWHYWARQMGLTILGENDNQNDDASGGSTAMTGLLGKFGNMEATVVYDDGPALGAAAAARDQGQRPPIVGDGGSSAGLGGVKAGELLATVQVDMVGMGLQAATAAYDLMTNQRLPLPKIVARHPILYTKQNVGQAQTWTTQLARLPGG